MLVMVHGSMVWAGFGIEENRRMKNGLVSNGQRWTRLFFIILQWNVRVMWQTETKTKAEREREQYNTLTHQVWGCVWGTDEALIILWIREMCGMQLIIIVNATLSTLGQGWTTGERAHTHTYKWIWKKWNSTHLGDGCQCDLPDEWGCGWGGVEWSGVKEDTAQIRSMYLFFLSRVSWMGRVV